MGKALKNRDELPTDLFLDNGTLFIGRRTGLKTAGNVFFIKIIRMAFFQNTAPVSLVLKLGCRIGRKQQMIPALPKIKEKMESGNFRYLLPGPEPSLVFRRHNPIVLGNDNLIVY